MTNSTISDRCLTEREESLEGTQTTSSEPVTATPIRSTRGRRTLRATVATLVLLLFASILGATPAQAAGGSAPDLIVCLKYSNGTPYANKPLYLHRYDSTGWAYTQRSTTANSSGCGRFNDVLTNHYFYVQGYWTYQIGYSWFYYNGNSAVKGVGNVYDGQYQAGTGYVQGPYQLS